ncbi:unnamed protein product [Camellia sinensis]
MTPAGGGSHLISLQTDFGAVMDLANALKHSKEVSKMSFTLSNTLAALFSKIFLFLFFQVCQRVVIKIVAQGIPYVNRFLLVELVVIQSCSEILRPFTYHLQPKMVLHTSIATGQALSTWFKSSMPPQEGQLESTVIPRFRRMQLVRSFPCNTSHKNPLNF